MKLSDIAPRNARANGKVQKLSDGWGLYLHVTAKGSKSWRLASRFEDKQKLLASARIRLSRRKMAGSGAMPQESSLPGLLTRGRGRPAWGSLGCKGAQEADSP